MFAAAGRRQHHEPAAVADLSAVIAAYLLHSPAAPFRLLSAPSAASFRHELDSFLARVQAWSALPTSRQQRLAEFVCLYWIGARVTVRPAGDRREAQIEFRDCAGSYEVGLLATVSVLIPVLRQHDGLRVLLVVDAPGSACCQLVLDDAQPLLSERCLLLAGDSEQDRASSCAALSSAAGIARPLWRRLLLRRLPLIPRRDAQAVGAVGFETNSPLALALTHPALMAVRLAGSDFQPDALYAVPGAPAQLLWTLLCERLLPALLLHDRRLASRAGSTVLREWCARYALYARYRYSQHQCAPPTRISAEWTALAADASLWEALSADTLAFVECVRRARLQARL